METGRLQRRWSESAPSVFDKETRIVCLDIKQESRENEQGETVNGYSFLPVEIDNLIDYGHIKSQLIEAGFAQKDEFGLLMNAVDGILNAIDQSSTWAKFKENLNAADISKFAGFCEFRSMCASAAHLVMDAYNA